jgi:hypothetical protein
MATSKEHIMPYHYDEKQRALIKNTLDEWMDTTRAYYTDNAFLIGRLAGMLEGALGRLDPKEAGVYIETMQDQTNSHRKYIVEEILEKKAA